MTLTDRRSSDAAANWNWSWSWSFGLRWNKNRNRNLAWDCNWDCVVGIVNLTAFEGGFVRIAPQSSWVPFTPSPFYPFPPLTWRCFWSMCLKLMLLKTETKRKTAKPRTQGPVKRIWTLAAPLFICLLRSLSLVA